MSYCTFSYVRPVKKTRKPHHCDWCNEVIEAGSPAMYIAGRWEDFYAGYAHVECETARESITSKEWNDMDHEYEHGSFIRGTKELKESYR